MVDFSFSFETGSRIAVTLWGGLGFPAQPHMTMRDKKPASLPNLATGDHRSMRETRGRMLGDLLFIAVLASRQIGVTLSPEGGGTIVFPPGWKIAIREYFPRTISMAYIRFIFTNYVADIALTFIKTVEFTVLDTAILSGILTI